VHLHDVDDHVDSCLTAYDELARLRDEGVVGAIGIGSNLVEPVRHLIDRARFDAFLLAGRYTLLDASGQALIEVAQSRGIDVVAGGVFNSGVLATWPQAASTYGYQPADAAIMGRTAEIAAICARHGVPLAAAALQFVLRNAAIATVLIGPRTVDQLEANVAAAELEIPRSFWSGLEGAGVIPASSSAHSLERT